MPGQVWTGAGSYLCGGRRGSRTKRAGMAAGAWSTGRYLGSIVGLVVLAPLLHGHPAAGAVRPVLLLAAVGAAISLAAALALPQHPADH